MTITMTHCLNPQCAGIVMRDEAKPREPYDGFCVICQLTLKAIREDKTKTEVPNDLHDHRNKRS